MRWSGDTIARRNIEHSLFRRPYTTSTAVDDEFIGTSLDPKWTVVSGSAGTVSLLDTTAGVARYQVVDRLLVQVAPSALLTMRQDYTIPDGGSVVAAVEVPWVGSGGDNGRFYLWANTDDTSPTVADAIGTGIEQDGGLFELQGLTDAISITGGVEITARDIASDLLYLRITRSGLLYRGWVSTNLGRSWSIIVNKTAAAALTNVWFYALGPSALGLNGGNPIYTVYWIRGGDDNLDPW